MQPTYQDYRTAVGALAFGKRLPGARYVWRETLGQASPVLREIVETAADTLALGPDFNLVKFHTTSFKLSLLSYPDFWDDPHPPLQESVAIDLASGRARRQSFASRPNPPILHRKETFLPPDHPRVPEFAALTTAEEQAGLFHEPHRIGFADNWARLLRAKGLGFNGHQLVQAKTGNRAHPSRADAATATGATPPGPPVDPPATIPDTDTAASSDQADQEPEPPTTTDGVRIRRDRTALVRHDFSAPVKTMLETGLLRPGTTFFDVGCGHGGDVAGLRQLGYRADGWDPVHRPDAERATAQVVNLGFVLNVIEDPAERVDTLARAWQLTESVLVITTLVAGQQPGPGSAQSTFGDGVLTSRQTFQKYYEQTELISLVELTLEVEPVPLGLGMVAAFRDDAEREAFVSRRYRRRVDWVRLSRRLGFAPPPRVRRDIYAAHRDLLDAYWDTLLELGRTPLEQEFDRLPEVRGACRSLPAAGRLMLEHRGEALWEAARERARDDLLVYLALARLDRQRTPASRLPAGIRRSIREFFGDHATAAEEALHLLHGAGSRTDLEIALEELDFGWIDDREGHFTIHRDLLERLPAVLRVYVGCGGRLYGDPAEADLIKIHLRSGKLTLHYFDDFMAQPFPELARRVKIDFRRLFVNVFDHPPGPDRQVLFFKERFLAADALGRQQMDQVSTRLRRLGLNETNVGHGAPVGQWQAFLKRRGLDRLLRKRG